MLEIHLAKWTETNESSNGEIQLVPDYRSFGYSAGSFNFNSAWAMSWEKKQIKSVHKSKYNLIMAKKRYQFH